MQRGAGYDGNKCPNNRRIFDIFLFQSLGVGGGRREEGGPAEEVSRREIIRRSAIQGVVGQDIFLPERSVMRAKHGHIYQVSGGCGEWVTDFIFGSL